MYCTTFLQVGHFCQQNEKLKQPQAPRNQEQQQNIQKKITKQLWMKAGQSKAVIQAETKNDKVVPGNKGKAKEGEVGWTEVRGRSAGKITETSHMEDTQQLVSKNGFNSLSEESDYQRMELQYAQHEKGEKVV